MQFKGGDWGSAICGDLARLHPDSVVALHLNLFKAIPPKFPSSFSDLLFHVMAIIDMSSLGKFTLSEREKKFLQKLKFYETTDSGYFKQQSTRPHSLGWALEDSPIGLLSWILEKFYYWTDCSGDLLNYLSKDEILTAISIYWFTRTATSSLRIYYEHVHSNESDKTSGYIKVPTAIMDSPKEIFFFPARWYKMCFNLKQHTINNKGGHFAAWEQSDIFVKDIRKFLFETTNWEENIELSIKHSSKVNGLLSILSTSFLVSISLSVGALFLMSAHRQQNFFSN